MTAPEPLPGMPDPAEAPRVRRESPRFHDLIHVTPRCHWCATQHSFAWGAHHGRRACRSCLGLTLRAGARRADTFREDLMGTGRPTKRARTPLVRAELWLHLAMTAEQRAKCCEDREPGVLPFADWPDDDALVTLCRTYSITPADLATACRAVAQQTEDRAIRNGYDDALDYAEGGPR